jgi:hypothetical protein
LHLEPEFAKLAKFEPEKAYLSYFPLKPIYINYKSEPEGPIPEMTHNPDVTLKPKMIQRDSTEPAQSQNY